MKTPLILVMLALASVLSFPAPAGAVVCYENTEVWEPHAACANPYCHLYDTVMVDIAYGESTTVRGESKPYLASLCDIEAVCQDTDGNCVDYSDSIAPADGYLTCEGWAYDHDFYNNGLTVECVAWYQTSASADSPVPATLRRSGVSIHATQEDVTATACSYDPAGLARCAPVGAACHRFEAGFVCAATWDESGGILGGPVPTLADLLAVR